MREGKMREGKMREGKMREGKMREGRERTEVSFFTEAICWKSQNCK